MTYNEHLARARQRYQNWADRDLQRAYYRLFAQMLLDLQADTAKGRLTAARAQELERQIKTVLSRLARDLDSLLQDQALQAATTLAVNGHRAALSSLSVETSLARVPERALKLMLLRSEAGGLSATFKTLITLRIRDLAPDIDQFLLSMVGRGVSWPQATTELARIFARENASVLEALGQLGARGGRTKAAIRSAKSISEEDLKEARGLLHHARRIVIHETNQAYQAADLVAHADSPVVDLVRWRLSGRHPHRDVCDLLAEHDSGYGVGLYKPETCPSLPHPFCRCHVDAVVRPVRAWDTPKRRVVKPRLVNSTVASSVLRGSTEGHISRQMSLANRALTAGYQAYNSQ